MAHYDVFDNCRDDDSLRNAFFDFTETVFPGVDFRSWYSRGFWKDKYIPFSIVQNDKIISNVSVTEMNIILDGQLVKGLQFGTVGTIPEFRNRGLSRYLMEYVLERYLNKIDFLFLFANESVLDFYPKFGFSQVSESIFALKSEIPRPAFNARQLSIDDNSDMTLIQSLLRQRMTLTDRFGAADYDFITLWHILNIFPQRLYYLEDEDAVFIVSENDRKAHIWDIICRKPFDVAAAIPKVLKAEVDSIIFYFTPEKIEIDYSVIEVPDDSPLFIRGEFPMAGKPFKFPITAQT